MHSSSGAAGFGFGLLAVQAIERVRQDARTGGLADVAVCDAEVGCYWPQNTFHSRLSDSIK